MTRATRALPFAALLWLSTSVANCSSSGPTPCKVADDCWNTPETQELGRCAPKDVACVQGSCRAACGAPCEVVDPNVNPCKDPELVCTQSQNNLVDLPFCAAAPIACVSAEDCPVAIPGSSSGAWSCEDEVCRFPGFRYAWE